MASWCPATRVGLRKLLSTCSRGRASSRNGSAGRNLCGPTIHSTGLLPTWSAFMYSSRGKRISAWQKEGSNSHFESAVI